MRPVYYYPQATYRAQFLQEVIGIAVGIAVLIMIGSEIFKSIKGVF